MLVQLGFHAKVDALVDKEKRMIFYFWQLIRNNGVIFHDANIRQAFDTIKQISSKDTP